MSRRLGVSLIVAAAAFGVLGSRVLLSLWHTDDTTTIGSDIPQSDKQQEQGPERDSDREARSAIELASTDATRDGPKGGDTPMPVAAPSHETREDAIRRSLTIAVQELEKATLQEQFWCAQRVLITSIAAIMDAAGNSTLTPQGPHEIQPPKGTFVFLYNGRTYRFREGEFPEYDDFMRAWQPGEKTGPRSIADLDPTGRLSSTARELVLDAQTIQQIKGRAAEAIAILGPGK